MKKILLLVTLLVLGCQLFKAQDSLEWKEEAYMILQERQLETENTVKKMSQKMNVLCGQIQTLSNDNELLRDSIDSLRNDYDVLYEAQEVDRRNANKKIDDAQESIVANQILVENRTLYGILILIVLVVIIAVSTWWLIRRVKRGSSSIDQIRKVQDTLQNAQARMQEESVKLDNKLLELTEQQLKTVSVETDNAISIDHSLALKVADEIVRIELNLSRMDPSIKGYKQLSKAVQRIKDNFQANGYEIVDMLGKPYVAGMKAAVTFVTDEDLSQGQQIITKVIKPQINYQQQMIQAAQIEVSQSE